MQVNEKLYIGGEWVEPETSATIDVISAHTEEVIGTVPDAAPADTAEVKAGEREASGLNVLRSFGPGVGRRKGCREREEGPGPGRKAR